MKRIQIDKDYFKEVCPDCGCNTFFVKGKNNEIGTWQVCSECGYGDFK